MNGLKDIFATREVKENQESDYHRQAAEVSTESISYAIPRRARREREKFKIKTATKYSYEQLIPEYQHRESHRDELLRVLSTIQERHSEFDDMDIPEGTHIEQIIPLMLEHLDLTKGRKDKWQVIISDGGEEVIFYSGEFISDPMSQCINARFINRMPRTIFRRIWIESLKLLGSLGFGCFDTPTWEMMKEYDLSYEGLTNYQELHPIYARRYLKEMDEEMQIINLLSTENNFAKVVKYFTPQNELESEVKEWAECLVIAKKKGLNLFHHQISKMEENSLNLSMADKYAIYISGQIENNWNTNITSHWQECYSEPEFFLGEALGQEIHGEDELNTLICLLTKGAELSEKTNNKYYK